MTPIGTGTPNAPNGGFEPKESSDGQYLFYLDRAPPGVTIDSTARLIGAALAGGYEELVLERVRPFLWSVTDKEIVFVSREPGTSTRLMSTVQRSADCPSRPPGISGTGELRAHDRVPRRSMGNGNRDGPVRL